MLSTIEIGILLLCILLDVHARYSTYRHYMQDSRQGQGQSEGKHEVWNHEGQHWKKVSESQLRVGQIIRVKSYLYSNIRNPVNMLPIHTESGVG